MTDFKGMGVALITPFDQAGNIDEAALKRVVKFQLYNEVDYLVVMGTTGEYVSLTGEEREKVKSIVIAENAGKVPLVLGIGGNSTAAVCKQLETENTSEFDAILSVSPYYNKPSQEGIYHHFKTVAAHSPLPIILYNVPGRTASNVLPETVARLAKDIENIIGIKEAAGDLVQATKMIAATPDDFLVISGDDMYALPMVLAGGAGVISVIGGGFPKEFRDMIAYALQRETDKAYELHYGLIEIIELIFKEGNPTGIKTVLNKLDLAETDVRLPLISASDELRNEIFSFIETYYN